MVIAIWLLLKITFIICGLFLLYWLVKSWRNDDQETLTNGLRNALEDCGFFFGRKNYSVELYKWVIDDREEVCEESYERSHWPAMDIADWMKFGLPCTPEGESMCGQNCSCQLVLSKKTRTTKSSS